MKYDIFRDSSNRLTVSFNKIPPYLYWWYRRKLVKEFNLIEKSKLVKNIDTKFQTFASDDKIINLEWDNWNGFSIVALDQNSESLLLECLDYLNSSK